MRNRIPCQRDAGTRLATALRRRPFSTCNKGNRRRLHAGKDRYCLYGNGFSNAFLVIASRAAHCTLNINTIFFVWAVWVNAVIYPRFIQHVCMSVYSKTIFGEGRTWETAVGHHLSVLQVCVFIAKPASAPFPLSSWRANKRKILKPENCYC